MLIPSASKLLKVDWIWSLLNEAICISGNNKKSIIIHCLPHVYVRM